MGFDPSVLFPAMSRAGLLSTASISTGLAAGREIQVGFATPDEVVLAGEMQAPQVVIEYQTRDAALRPGDQLVISGVSYRVIQKPRRRGDGFFSLVQLGEA